LICCGFFPAGIQCAVTEKPLQLSRSVQHLFSNVGCKSAEILNSPSLKIYVQCSS